MSTLPQAIVDAVRDALNHPEKALPLHEPTFAGNESANLQECIDSTFVSTVGKFVDQFEQQLAAYTGARHVVAVVNGTAALHIALLLAGVKPGDEVVLPAFTFIGPANAVRYCNAVPHFVDSNEETLGMDPTALRQHLSLVAEVRGNQCINRETGSVIRAMVPVHVFGHPCEMHELLEIAEDFNLEVVEDAAESLGSWYQDRHTGTLGKLGVLSFNGNKIITTGGGGAILTNDPDLARHAKHITTTAKIPHRWEYIHDSVGYNYRLPNLNAAIGCAQLEQLPQFLTAKRRLHQAYTQSFADLDGVSLINEPMHARSNHWLQAILLDPAIEPQRDTILQATHDHHLLTRPAWQLMHRSKPHQDSPRGPLPVAQSIGRRLICLPSSANLV